MGGRLRRKQSRCLSRKHNAFKKTRLRRFRKTSKIQRPQSRQLKSSRKNIGGSTTTESQSTSVASNTNNEDVKVEVTKMDGQTITFDMEKNNTILDLKKKIIEKSGIPMWQQDIIHELKRDKEGLDKVNDSDMEIPEPLNDNIEINTLAKEKQLNVFLLINPNRFISAGNATSISDSNLIITQNESSFSLCLTNQVATVEDKTAVYSEFKVLSNNESGQFGAWIGAVVQKDYPDFNNNNAMAENEESYFMFMNTGALWGNKKTNESAQGKHPINIGDTMGVRVEVKPSGQRGSVRFYKNRQPFGEHFEVNSQLPLVVAIQMLGKGMKLELLPNIEAPSLPQPDA